ncbi:MAG: hypothetical protein ACC661_09465, partial [Verrucomicrobiales bacterium]
PAADYLFAFPPAPRMASKSPSSQQRTKPSANILRSSQFGGDFLGAGLFKGLADHIVRLVGIYRPNLEKKPRKYKVPGEKEGNAY